MATGATFVVHYRRKREKKTNYKKRLDMLKSKKPRLVVGHSNKHASVQIVEYTKTGDKVLASAHSGELKTYGWTAATSNVPAAYLTGLLCGKKADSKKVKEVILDIGDNPSIKGSRIYASLKGLVDSGIAINHDESVFPGESRIRGEHISNYNKDKANLPEVFEKTKKAILGEIKKNGRKESGVQKGSE